MDENNVVTDILLTNVKTVGKSFLHEKDMITGGRFPEIRDGVNIANKYKFKVGLDVTDSTHQNLVEALTNAMDSAHKPNTTKDNILKVKNVPLRDSSGKQKRDAGGKGLWVEDPTTLTLEFKSQMPFNVTENGQPVTNTEDLILNSGTTVDVTASINDYEITGADGKTHTGIYLKVTNLDIKSRPKRISIPNKKK